MRVARTYWGMQACAAGMALPTANLQSAFPFVNYLTFRKQIPFL
jgi:hypothetical protein